MIKVEFFKTINGINAIRYDYVPHFDFMEISGDLIRTRGKLVQHHCHYDLRKMNFINCTIPIWNSLWYSERPLSTRTLLINLVIMVALCNRADHYIFAP